MAELSGIPRLNQTRIYMPLLTPAVLPILLLVGSNLFMTTAWYGHLKFPSAAMWIAVMASWAIALIEYWMAVPANRIGYGTYTGAELKAIQEVISIAVFVGFSVVVLGEKLTINTGIGFTLIGVGAFFIFNGPFK